MALSVLIAAGLDQLGEPPVPWHPVVWYGKLISKLERFAPEQPGAQLWYGLLMLVLAGPVVALPALTGQYLILRIQRGRHPLLRTSIAALLLGGALKPLFALRMLIDSGKAVRLALEQENLAEARQALRSLVSRKRDALDAELVAAAAIESLAENLSDSVVAPLCYYALFGLPGAALYRLYNTFDSMIGYHGRYEYLGKAAARLDDLLNLLPARLTALLIILCASLFGGEWRRAWRIWRRDAGRTESPNAGRPMAAAAGALGLQLEKTGHYTLGVRERAVMSCDIERAERMVKCVGGIMIALSVLIRFLSKR